MKFAFDRIPTTVEEFQSLDNFSLKSPHNTVALLMLALCRYVEDEKTAIEMINVLKGPAPLTHHEILFHKERLGDKAYLPKSFFEGASPANEYTPTMPLTIEIYDDTLQSTQPGFTRLFVQSSGADNRRPVNVRQKGDDYFIYDYSGLLSGIRVPSSTDSWA